MPGAPGVPAGAAEAGTPTAKASTAELTATVANLRSICLPRSCESAEDSPNLGVRRIRMSRSAYRQHRRTGARSPTVTTAAGRADSLSSISAGRTLPERGVADGRGRRAEAGPPGAHRGPAVGGGAVPAGDSAGHPPAGERDDRAELARGGGHGRPRLRRREVLGGRAEPARPVQRLVRVAHAVPDRRGRLRRRGGDDEPGEVARGLAQPAGGRRGGQGRAGRPGGAAALRPSVDRGRRQAVPLVLDEDPVRRRRGDGGGRGDPGAATDLARCREHPRWRGGGGTGRLAHRRESAVDLEGAAVVGDETGHRKAATNRRWAGGSTARRS